MVDAQRHCATHPAAVQLGQAGSAAYQVGKTLSLTQAIGRLHETQLRRNNILSCKSDAAAKELSIHWI